MARGVPETHLTFEYLPKTNNRIIVFGYGAGRINPETPGTYEIHVFLAEPHINDPNLKNFRKPKLITLYIGVSHEENLDFIPPGASFKGDFRKVSKVELASKYKKFRFTPVKEGVATLSVHDKPPTPGEE